MSDKQIDGSNKIWKNTPILFHENSSSLNINLIDNFLDLVSPGSYSYVIFNTLLGECEYISHRVLNVLGIKSENLFLENFISLIHPDDVKYIFNFEKQANSFFKKLEKNLMFKYKVSYDYRFQIKEGNYCRILHQTIPLDFFDNGGGRTLIILNDINHLNIQGAPKLSFIGMDCETSYFDINANENVLVSNKKFTEREIEILKLMFEGNTSEQIANILFRSIHTVNNHRKNILRKSGCSSINELIIKAMREGWV